MVRDRSPTEKNLLFYLGSNNVGIYLHIGNYKKDSSMLTRNLLFIIYLHFKIELLIDFPTNYTSTLKYFKPQLLLHLHME